MNTIDRELDELFRTGTIAIPEEEYPTPEPEEQD